MLPIIIKTTIFLTIFVNYQKAKIFKETFLDLRNLHNLGIVLSHFLCAFVYPIKCLWF